MLRPFLSLVVAAGATTAGLGCAWAGAGLRLVEGARGRPEFAGAILTLVGVLLVGIAAMSIAIHWLGALTVGGIQGFLGAIALVFPLGNPFEGGLYNPVFEITRMLSAIDRDLGDSAAVYFFCGAALLTGAFLVGAALGIRTRRLNPPAGRRSRLGAIAVSAPTLLGATALFVLAGGQFARGLFETFRFESALAALVVFGAVLAGIAGLTLRWSSAGVVLVGVAVVVTGVAAFSVSGLLVVGFPGRLPGAYGFILLLGSTYLGAALAGMVPDRPRYRLTAEPGTLSD